MVGAKAGWPSSACSCLTAQCRGNAAHGLYAPHSASLCKRCRLLELFCEDAKLLERRGSLIVCQLCAMLDPQRIFLAIADILLTYEDLSFAQQMVCCARLLGTNPCPVVLEVLLVD